MLERQRFIKTGENGQEIQGEEFVTEYNPFLQMEYDIQDDKHPEHC